MLTDGAPSRRARTHSGESTPMDSHDIAAARHRKNKRAVKLGICVFISGLIVLLTGLLLIQIFPNIQLPQGTLSRRVVYWLHIVVPVAAVGLYILHRRAGPDINWRWGYGW